MMQIPRHPTVAQTQNLHQPASLPAQKKHGK